MLWNKISGLLVNFCFTWLKSKTIPCIECISRRRRKTAEDDHLSSCLRFFHREKSPLTYNMNARRTKCFVFFLWPVSCRSLRWGKGLAGPEDVRGRQGGPRPCGKRGVSHLWRVECRPRRGRCQQWRGGRRLDIPPMSPGNTGTSARVTGPWEAQR